MSFCTSWYDFLRFLIMDTSNIVVCLFVLPFLSVQYDFRDSLSCEAVSVLQCTCTTALAHSDASRPARLSYNRERLLSLDNTAAPHCEAGRVFQCMCTAALVHSDSSRPARLSYNRERLVSLDNTAAPHSADSSPLGIPDPSATQRSSWTFSAETAATSDPPMYLSLIHI
eukprot:TRINITY_DN16517_c0_g1_i10.p1 TRINITY_DN16517_c0_g1~~TRINITY_DN16517_c0_g1_i10.p1  ORF type:complete len:170 (-),score=21.15 TRINITY_DN16517_c0_g1_i10:35-544(-)